MAPIIPLLNSSKIGVTTSRPVFLEAMTRSIAVGSWVAPGGPITTQLVTYIQWERSTQRFLGPNEPLREEVNK